MRGLVLDEKAVSLLAQSDISSEWFSSFEVGKQIGGLSRKKRDDIVYIIDKGASESSRFLIIDASIFSQISDLRHGFDRILHVALSHFDRRVSIPINFHQFNHGSLLSIYAQPLSKGVGTRVYFDRSPLGSSTNIYCYGTTAGAIDITSLRVDYYIYRESIKSVIDVILDDAGSDINENARGVELVAPLATSFVGSSSLSEWYETKLTAQQRNFVDRDLRKPVKLKGAAGTGKTLALVVKCLRERLLRSSDKSDFRIAFITHSHSLAHDVVRGMIDSLEPKMLAEARRGEIWIGSLYELIQDIMEYERKRLTPLSLDGRDGREFQRIVIETAIEELERESSFVFGPKAACSESFLAWLDISRRDRFISLLSQEFAALLDADGVRMGNSASERYRNAKRESWQLEAPTEADRDVVLRIHDRYGLLLDKSSMLSMDQMVADFSKYLETHEWRQLKVRQGFNLVFVDELHYFNHMERMTFHNLFRREAIIEGNCPLFTAQDIRQSTTDVALSRGGIALRVGQTDSVEFTKIFRSTAAISAFLHDIDGAFPALDLHDELGAPPTDNARDEGVKPTLFNRDREVDAVDAAFDMARIRARELGGRNVAILCTDERSFDEYIKWGRLDSKYTLLNGRDELGKLKYAGSRPIFSIPDYVAGLQFSDVILLNVERYQEDVIDRTMGEKRRFISRLYLGASRASDRLSFVCSTAKGGRAEILDGAIEGGRLLVAGS